jgi:hypothetical protein
MELTLIVLGMAVVGVGVWLYKHHVSIATLKTDIEALKAKYSKQ